MSYDNQYPYYQQYSQQYPTQQYPAQGDPNQGGYYAPQASWSQGWLAFNDPGYIKGLILGAGLTYLLTNPKVQKAVVKGAVTLWTSIQGGMEEVKEQIQDIKAEMSMKADDAQE